MAVDVVLVLKFQAKFSATHNLMSTEEEPSQRELLLQLGIQEITARMKGLLRNGQEERHNKECLIDYVIDHAPSETVEFLCDAGREKVKAVAAGRGEKEKERTAVRKRKRVDEVPPRQTAPRIDEDSDGDDYDPSQFLQLPSDKEVKECYSRFFKATSNAALHSGTCGICAQESSVHEDGLTEVLTKSR